jgi:hypothetical protein
MAALNVQVVAASASGSMSFAPARRMALWLLLALSAVGGCDPGSVTLFQPIAPAGPATGIIELHVVHADGTPAGGALVSYLRVQQYDFDWRNELADAEGRIRLLVPPGHLYWIAAEVHSEELGILGGGVRRWVLPGDSIDAQLVVSPPRTEGLVISEAFLLTPPTWETGNQPYRVGKYLEVANLGQETVHLDGMLIGVGYPYWRDSGQFGHHRCQDTEAVRNDPDGVWAETMWRFPGGGTDHPLLPGEAALLAVVAADHREVHPSMLDLSGARFEFGWEGYGDNPSAANLVHLGPTELTAFYNPFSFGPWFIADPTAYTSLPTVQDPGGTASSTRTYKRVPRASVQDFVYSLWDGTGGFFPGPSPIPCTDPVHVNFDAIPGGFQQDGDLFRSYQRRRVTVAGRSILLDTNTSYVDFVLVERSPGWLP